MTKLASLSLLLLLGCSYPQPAPPNETVPREQIRLPENERSVVVAAEQRERRAEIHRRMEKNQNQLIH